MRRFLALSLALLLMIPLFAACGKDKTQKLTLFENGEGLLVYDSELITAKEASAFAASVEEATGATLKVLRGYGGDGPHIVLGNVNVENVKAVTTGLRVNDYTLKISGGDYVIGATTATALKAAMQYFLDNILTAAKDGVLKLTSKNDYAFTGTYQLSSFSVGGVSLSDMQIVVPKNASVSEYRTAVALQQYLYGVGYSLPLKTGAADDGAAGKIVIGTSLCEKAKPEREHAYAVAVNGTTLEIAAESFYGYAAVQTALTKTVFSADAKHELDDSVTFSGIGSAKDAVLSRDGDIRIMFNNIHGNCNLNEFPVAPVAQMMGEVFAEYLPDVLGLQECSPALRSTGNLMAELAPIYTEVDVSGSTSYLNNKRQNSTPLFYRADTVEVLRAGYFCYNDLPYNNEAYADLWQGQNPNKLLDENLNSNNEQVTVNGRRDTSKSVTWAIFRSKATGNIFMVASTHLWWENNEVGDRVVRQIQMCYLKDLLMKESTDYLAEIGSEAEVMPTFVGGDYNAKYSNKNNAPTKMVSETPLILCEKGISSKFENTNDKVSESNRISISTHHGYATWNSDLGIYEKPQYSTGEYGNSLDYIFGFKAASAMYRVQRSALADDLYSYLSSDHIPLLIDFSFEASAPKA